MTGLIILLAALTPTESLLQRQPVARKPRADGFLGDIWNQAAIATYAWGAS